MGGNSRKLWEGVARRDGQKDLEELFLNTFF